MCLRMVDKGPLLTSAIIFYLSIGAAIFQVLEEPNWDRAMKHYTAGKERILRDYPCLNKTDLDKILEVNRVLEIFSPFTFPIFRISRFVCLFGWLFVFFQFSVHRCQAVHMLVK